jgi:peptide/nickel transport system substrate-binding protein
LVYALSPRKIPNGEQFRHLKKFLNPSEYLVIKVCSLVILVNLLYLGFAFITEHLQYLPANGGEYVEGVVGYPQTINPIYAVNRDIDGDLSRLIYSRLFRYDDQGRLGYDLVEKMETSADGKEYLLTIRNGVKWHNGEDLSVDDILFTFNLIQNPDYRSPLRSGLSAVSAEKVDDRTLRFKISEAYAPFPELLTFGILPKSLWESVAPASALLSDLNLKPIGSGPFKFKSLVRNSDGDLKEYSLAANTDYYNQAPYLKGINFKFFANLEEAIAALNDKQIAGLNYLPFADRALVLAKNSLQFHDLSQPRIVSLFFNSAKNKAVADKEVRLSLARAINKDQLLQDVFAGVYSRADGPIWSGSSVYNQDLVKYDYAPDLAASTIKSKPLSLALTVIDSGNNLAVAEKLKAYWEAVGVKVEIKTVASEQAAAMVKDRNFEVLLYGQSVGGDPDVYAFWHSSQTGGRGLNLSAYNSAEVDKLLTEARVSSNPAERQEKYQKLQRLVTSDLPAIFLYSPAYTYVQAKALRGFSGTAIIEPADRFNGANTWYIKTSKKLTW